MGGAAALDSVEVQQASRTGREIAGASPQDSFEIDGGKTFRATPFWQDLMHHMRCALRWVGSFFGGGQADADQGINADAHQKKRGGEADAEQVINDDLHLDQGISGDPTVDQGPSDRGDVINGDLNVDKSTNDEAGAEQVINGDLHLDQGTNGDPSVDKGTNDGGDVIDGDLNVDLGTKDGADAGQFINGDLNVIHGDLNVDQSTNDGADADLGISDHHNGHKKGNHGHHGGIHAGHGGPHAGGKHSHHGGSHASSPSDQGGATNGTTPVTVTVVAPAGPGTVAPLSALRGADCFTRKTMPPEDELPAWGLGLCLIAEPVNIRARRDWVDGQTDMIDAVDPKLESYEDHDNFCPVQHLGQKGAWGLYRSACPRDVRSDGFGGYEALGCAISGFGQHYKRNSNCFDIDDLGPAAWAVVTAVVHPGARKYVVLKYREDMRPDLVFALPAAAVADAARQSADMAAVLASKEVIDGLVGIRTSDDVARAKWLGGRVRAQLRERERQQQEARDQQRQTERLQAAKTWVEGSRLNPQARSKPDDGPAAAVAGQCMGRKETPAEGGYCFTKSDQQHLRHLSPACVFVVALADVVRAPRPDEVTAARYALYAGRCAMGHRTSGRHDTDDWECLADPCINIPGGEVEIAEMPIDGEGRRLLEIVDTGKNGKKYLWSPPAVTKSEGIVQLARFLWNQA